MSDSNEAVNKELETKDILKSDTPESKDDKKKPKKPKKPKKHGITHGISTFLFVS